LKGREFWSAQHFMPKTTVQRVSIMAMTGGILLLPVVIGLLLGLLFHLRRRRK
jgi:hypothetical protein